MGDNKDNDVNLDQEIENLDNFLNEQDEEFPLDSEDDDFHVPENRRMDQTSSGNGLKYIIYLFILGALGALGYFGFKMAPKLMGESPFSAIANLQNNVNDRSNAPAGQDMVGEWSNPVVEQAAEMPQPMDSTIAPEEKMEVASSIAEALEMTQQAVEEQLTPAFENPVDLNELAEEGLPAEGFEENNMGEIDSDIVITQEDIIDLKMSAEDENLSVDSETLDLPALPNEQIEIQDEISAMDHQDIEGIVETTDEVVESLNEMAEAVNVAVEEEIEAVVEEIVETEVEEISQETVTDDSGEDKVVNDNATMAPEVDDSVTDINMDSLKEPSVVQEVEEIQEAVEEAEQEVVDVAVEETIEATVEPVKAVATKQEVIDETVQNVPSLPVVPVDNVKQPEEKPKEVVASVKKPKEITVNNKPLEPVDPRVEQARKLYNEHDFANALALYQAVLKDNPSSTAALTGVQLSNAKLRLNSSDPSVTVYKTEMPQEVTPNAVTVSGDDVSNALSKFKQDPRNPKIAVELADAYAKAGDREKALSAYRRALQLDVIYPSGIDRMAIYDAMAALQ